MKTKLELTPKELESLKLILEYMNDSESTDYEIHIDEGGKKSDHIFHHVKMIDKVVNKGK
jgi:hypothetical protein